MYVCTYVCVPLYVYMYVYAYQCVSLCVSDHMCLFVYIRMSAPMCVPIYVCLCDQYVSMLSLSLGVSTYMCPSVRLSVPMCVYIYVWETEQVDVGDGFQGLSYSITGFIFYVNFKAFSPNHCTAEKATVKSYRVTAPSYFPWSLLSSLRSHGRPVHYPSLLSLMTLTFVSHDYWK